MSRLSNCSFRRRLNSIVLQGLLISTIFTTLSASLILFNSEAYANGKITKEEVKMYAGIVIDMEIPRQQAYDKIKKIYQNRDIPNIVCNNPKSFGKLPGKAKKIANDYCKRSREIVKSHGLSIERFNKITEAAKKDKNIEQQIYEALLKKQRGRKSS